jgi:hypothetical protein
LCLSYPASPKVTKSHDVVTWFVQWWPLHYEPA